jgi:hypothetical protein
MPASKTVHETKVRHSMCDGCVLVHRHFTRSQSDYNKSAAHNNGAPPPTVPSRDYAIAFTNYTQSVINMGDTHPVFQGESSGGSIRVLNPNTASLVGHPLNVNARQIN